MNVLDRLRFVPLAAVAIAAMVSTSLATETPVTQVPDPEGRNIHRVEKYAHVAAFLNLGQGTVRIVAVVPTGLESSLGVVDTLASIVHGTPSKRLRVYVILRGENDADSPLHAAVLAGRASDPRLVYFWDPTGDVARAWASSETACAWLYDTSAKFADAPPKASLTVSPTSVGHDARLAGASLRATSGEMIRRVEAMRAQPGTGP
jgi:hypothetical protein